MHGPVTASLLLRIQVTREFCATVRVKIASKDFHTPSHAYGFTMYYDLSSYAWFHVNH
jgi:hypothetical protein